MDSTKDNGLKGENHTEGSSAAPRLMDYLALLFRWKKFIIANVLVITAIAVVVSLVLPKSYKATATVLPPKDQGLLNLFGAPSTMLRGLSSLPRISGLNTQSGAYNYFAILKSRSAMEAVVRKFDLLSVYGIDDSSTEKAIKQLRDNTSFELQDDDYISIDVYDESPRRAADIANYFVDLLNTMSIELGTREARNNREFIETRLAETKDTLRKAEDALKKYQVTSGMMLTPEQTSSISAIADLYGMKAKKEVELAILERRVTPDNEALQQLRLELRELDKKLASMPETGLETLRLYRNVITEQKILEVLLPLYEQARIDEQKDVPVLLLLDRAVPPEQRAKPQRRLIVLLAFMLSAFASIAAAFVLQGFSVHVRPENQLDLKLQSLSGRIARLYRVRSPAR